MKTSANQWLALAGFTAVCFAAAGIGSMLTVPYINGWYATLRKPWWNPPNWLFGPVWTLLYCSMAAAAWLVWRRSGFSGAALPLTLFFVQLVLNAAWSGLFFALQNPPAAFIDIVLLWAAIAATGVLFWQIAPAAGWLMAPYLAWVTFAAALNYAIWRLNS